jgi:hypothetical protein
MGDCIPARYLSHDGYPMHGEHRRAYEDAVGPIPVGYQIDHICLNRACINPDHLEAVTPLENQRRKVLKIPLIERPKIERRLAAGEKAIDLAQEYGVSVPRILQFKKTRLPKSIPLLDAVEEALNVTVSGSNR